MRQRAVYALLACFALLAAGCSSSGSSSAPASPTGAATTSATDTAPAAAPDTTATTGAPATTSPAQASCTASTMQTHAANTLTVATDSPAYEPWYVDNKPSNGKGYESAVAYAVGKQLGYSADQVKWVVASFDSVIAPTPKNYDFDINQVSITPQRAKVVDFSSGYYDVTQAIVAMKGSKYANAGSIAALHGAKLGAQVASTSLDAINDDIKPGPAPAEYPQNILAIQAMKNGQIDGIVVDLPTALYITSAQVPGSTIVGQIPAGTNPEQFGLVLSKGSPLTSCVSQAVNTLRSNGTLARLEQRWLTRSAGAPVLR